jgi:hypothetical protein
MPGLLSERWGVVPAVVTLLLGADVAYSFASDGRWFGMVMFGILLPLVGVSEWFVLRRRGYGERFAADRMMITFMVAILLIGLLVRDG